MPDGASEEGRAWNETAARRYEEPLARHVEAFADHAAAFLLESDPSRAVELARINLEVSDSPGARAL